MSRRADATRQALPAPQRFRAFGLDLELWFPLPGCHAPPATSSSAERRPVRVELTSRATMDAEWPADTKRLTDKRRADGRRFIRLESHDEAGWSLTALHWGRYDVSADGRRIRCAPTVRADKRWQRYFVGQVLPLAALVGGLEVIHASAVANGTEVIAFVGGSRAGKSTLSTAMRLRGWSSLADDVIALEDTTAGVVAHPATGLASVRRSAIDSLVGTDTPALGPVVAEDEEALWVTVPVAPNPGPLGTVYFIDRTTETGLPRIEPLDPVDPRLLLGSTFNALVHSSDRLTRQLDIFAQLSMSAKFHRLAIPRGVGPREIAEQVEAHLARDS